MSEQLSVIMLTVLGAVIAGWLGLLIALLLTLTAFGLKETIFGMMNR